MMDATFCPATMCPLFAAEGSTLSGAVNATCEREACRWFDGTICQAGRVAIGEVAMASAGANSRTAVPGAARRQLACPFFLPSGLDLIGDQILVDDDDAQHAELERDL
jgi:hypothetical protein